MAKMGKTVDVEKLIELVRKYPSLYNPNDPHYKDAQLSKNLWESIGKSLNISGIVILYFSCIFTSPPDKKCWICLFQVCGGAAAVCFIFCAQ